MQTLFTHTITNWFDWGRVFQDKEAFAPLIHAIYAREKMPALMRIDSLTPGTNAVFRCGDTVVKIFAPRESGLQSDTDFAVETAVLRHLQALGIPTSELLAEGRIEDRYDFPYVILRYVAGVEAGRALPAMERAERATFAQRMRGLTDTLHQPCPGLLPAIDLRARALTNERLTSLPQRLRGSLTDRARRVSWRQDVIVHGDLTGENVLLMAEREPVLIDCADSVSGPAWYELAPLVFELFQCDSALVHGYLGADDAEAFVQRLLDSLCLHDFGANILQTWASREAIDLEAIPSIDAVGEWLLRRW